MSSIRCGNCGLEFEEGGTLCKYCGSPPSFRCPKCNADVLSTDRFCSECGTPLSEAPPTKERGAERRHAAVLFCDLVGSTTLSGKLDPEDLREVIRAYHNEGSLAIRRYDGHVAKFLGDGIVAFFGFPTAHEDDSRRAILAGLALCEAAGRLQERFRPQFDIDIAVRIGIHSGLVIAGDMGAMDQPVVDIVGETPNLAARLQELASSNSVVVSADTHRLTSLDFDFERMGEFELKGIERLIEVFRVLAPSEPSQTPRTSRRMVGRQSELGQLGDVWRKSMAGKGQCVLLSGESGMGKSTLVNSMIDVVERQKDGAVVYLRCSPYHQNTPFHPIVEYLRTTQMQISRDDPAEVQLDKVVHFVDDRGFDSSEIVPILASLLSIPYEHRFKVPILSPEGRRIKTMEALDELAVRRASNRSVLLVVDNVHWADPSTLELLRRILDRVGGIRMLAMVTFRPHFQPDWPEAAGALTLRIERLPPDDVDDLVKLAANGRALPANVLQQIHERTDGIPLFIEEMTKAIIESGTLDREEAGSDPSAPLGDFAIPTTLHGSLVARLEKAAQHKEVAQVASVVGREFTSEVVAAVAQLDVAIVDREIMNLVSAELVQSVDSFYGGARTYRFRHALIQDAAYDSLLRTVRQQYHNEIASTIERLLADTAEEQPEVIANHYTSGGKSLEAIKWWLLAGQKAMARSANIEAVSHFSKGLEQLQSLPEGVEKTQMELELLTLRGLPLIATRGFAASEVGENFERAEQICEAIGDTPLLFPVLWGHWVFNLVRSRLERAVQYSEQMLRLADISGDSGMRIEAQFTFGNALFWLARLDEGRDHLNEALALYDPAVHQSHTMIYGQDPCVSTLCYLSYTYWALGDICKAYESVGRANAMAAEITHPFTIGWGLAFECLLQNWNRDYEAARTQGQRSYDYCAEQGQAFWLNASMISWGSGTYWTGEKERGLEMMLKGFEGYCLTGSVVVIPLWRAMIAEAMIDSNLVAEAEHWIRTGLEEVQRLHEYVSEPYLRRLLGDILRIRGDSDAALAEYRHAFEVAKAQSSRMRALQALMALYELVGSEEIRKELVECLAYFPQDCPSVDVESARRLVAG